MTAIISFLPLCGIEREEPLSYLLEVDDCFILLDCGWNPLLPISVLDPLKPYIKKISAVLISHSDLDHLGGLAYAVGKLGLNAPIYSTIPVYKMGQMFMYDFFQSKEQSEDFGLFSLDDIDAAFDLFHQLKYSQTIQLPQGITISPFAAGHTVGGTIWKIRKETEEIVYAVDTNHKPERHLQGASWDKVVRPTLLITDTYNLMKQKMKQKNRQQEIIDSTIETLRNEGNVLFPIDTAGRILELLLILDQHWISNKSLSSYPIIALTNVAFNTIEFAKSQLEWMSDSVMKAFEHSRENQFSFKYVKPCHDLTQLNAFQGPKVILASLPDMESGYSRELFVQNFASNPKNLVIFTIEPTPGSLSDQVLNQNNKTLTVQIKKKVPLEGEELLEFKENKKKSILDNSQTEDKDDEESDSDEEPLLHNILFDNFHDMSYSQFIERGIRHPMFPSNDRYKMFDDYGEILVPSEFAFEFQMDIDKKVSEEPVEEIEEKQEPIPTKCISETNNISLNCLIKNINFEGRSDDRSVKNVLEQVSPRKLILIRGNQESKIQLAKFIQSSLENVCKGVFCPMKEEKVDVSSDTNIYKVKLKENLFDNLHFSKVKDYSLAYVNSIVRFSSSQPTVESGIIQNMNSKVPILEPATESTGHKSVILGDLKLSDFRTILSQAGYKSDMTSGVLVTCNGSIALRKEVIDGVSTIKIEGVISSDYFKIRELLYSQFTIL